MSTAESDVRALLGRGDALLAFDRATASLTSEPENLGLRYLAALALARAGAPDRAAAELAKLTSAAGPALQDAGLAEDVAALQARLVKDNALSHAGKKRTELAARASTLYEQAFREFEGHFACINAATMAVVAGDHRRAAGLAAEARALAGKPVGDPNDLEERYWRLATTAEANLILADADAATDALTGAAKLSRENLALRATTRRQLALLCNELDMSALLLDSLPVPVVIHYTGHRLNIAPASEERLREHVAAALDRLHADVAYGALAYGADIVVAEEVLARGGELHVILPCTRDEFVDSSVRLGQGTWVARFEACLAAATSVQSEPSSAQPDDPSMYEFGSRLAMGAAVIRATALTSTAVQLAVWDGRRSDGIAGTAADMAYWQGTGRSTEVIAWDRPPPASPGPASTPDRTLRELRAMLFADFKDFSKLDERQVFAFFEKVMTEVSATIESFGHSVLSRNSWGDGLYLVFDSVQEAARCGLALQHTMGALNLEELGLPTDMGLRIGIHAGPVFSAVDPVTGQPTFFGTHVTRTARIEPRTPPGEVYLTASSAALLALEPLPAISAEYVGRLQLAKEYDVLPMYVLRHVGGASEHFDDD